MKLFSKVGMFFYVGKTNELHGGTWLNDFTEDEVNLFVENKGKGPPCLYVHGGPGYWSLPFEKTAGPIMEKYYSMFYLDQRGCGRSGYSSKFNYSIKNVIGDFESVRLENNINKWTLCAHSFGAILAVNYALIHPHRIEKLILSNPCLFLLEAYLSQYLMGRKILKRTGVFVEENERSLLEKSIDITNLLRQNNLYAFLHYSDLNMQEKILDIDLDYTGKQNFKDYVQNSLEYHKNFKTSTQYVNHPTLIFSGTNDYIVGPNHFKKLNFTNSKIIMVNGKHHSYLENPDLFEKEIRYFISS